MFNRIIVGIDPGLTVTGYGVIRGGETLQVVSKGEIRPGADLSFARRLDVIFSGIERILAESAPEAVAVEGLFHAKNVSSAFKLAHARGVVLLAAARRDVPVFEYSPREVKSAVTGYGAAEKGQVESMIRAILCIEGKVSSHACDALAVALCHHHGARLRAIQGAV
ncbi:MAG: crossover junction endodeoxyribonuclease RuvC [Deltaproteobacteria bacterium]|nr:crossover junction endodeoxyribonuclease RuvC [Candidatus Zymogenaceae bacterium]